MQTFSLLFLCLTWICQCRRTQRGERSAIRQPQEDSDRIEEPTRSKARLLAALLQAIDPSVAFHALVPSASRTRSTQLSMGAPLTDRRSLLTGTAAAAAVALAGRPLAAFADFRGPNKELPTDDGGINAYLQGFGYKKIDVPSGFKLCLKYIGFDKAANMDGQNQYARPFDFPLLVVFAYPGFPQNWKLKSPFVDENGESGNIQADDYGKGDSIRFTAKPPPEGFKSVADLKKSWFRDNWIKVVDVGGDVFTDEKVDKVEVVTQPDGFEMAIARFRYSVATRGGGLIPRWGYASAMKVTSEKGNDVIVGVTAESGEKRWDDMKTVANSARVFGPIPKKKIPFWETQTMARKANVQAYALEDELLQDFKIR